MDPDIANPVNSLNIIAMVSNLDHVSAGSGGIRSN